MNDGIQNNPLGHILALTKKLLVLMGLQGANKMLESSNHYFYLLPLNPSNPIIPFNSIHIHRNPLDGFLSFLCNLRKFKEKSVKCSRIGHTQEFFGRLNPKKPGKKQMGVKLTVNLWLVKLDGKGRNIPFWGIG